MKWTVLSDNRSCDEHLITEHGLSILLETDRYKILLDTGASDVFLRNASMLGLNLTDVNYVFISHGHSDHAGGLQYLLSMNQQAQVVVSQTAITGKFYSKRLALHSITTDWREVTKDRLLVVTHTCEVAEKIYAIAKIPHIHPMPKGNQYLYMENENGQLILDDFRHELGLYVDGLLFTGCAHNGLENILAACPWPVHSVVGGFHLLDRQETEEEIKALAHKLKTNYPETQFYTSHCTGDGVFKIMKGVMGNQLHAFSLGTITNI
ncbi:MAG: MBL fold metallo-hydrolase [Bacteroidaceae bacterium]|nr:MBL fold metallo-hydrolase [Bacteroidaceae bacterium]